MVNRKPSVRQRRVAEIIIENSVVDKPLTNGEIVEASGYGPSMKKNPQVVINSDGVQEALADAGFTEDNAKRVVSEILLNENVSPGHRLDAAKEVFKVRGSYAPEKSVTMNIPIPIDDLSKDNSIQAHQESHEAHTSDTRGNISLQDSIDNSLLDSEGAER